MAPVKKSMGKPLKKNIVVHIKSSSEESFDESENWLDSDYGEDKEDTIIASSEPYDFYACTAQNYEDESDCESGLESFNEEDVLDSEDEVESSSFLFLKNLSLIFVVLFF